LGDGNDQVRIWAKVDGDEGPIWLSETDLLKAMQPHMTRTSEAAFALLRQEIPSIARESVKAFIAEQEDQKKKVAAQLGYIVEPDGTIRPRVPALRSFLQKNAVSLTLFIILALILAPELMRWAASHIPLIRWMTGG